VKLLNFNISLSLSLFLCSLVLSSISVAQKNEPKAPRTEVLNFEDELVEGQSAKPELFYLLQKKNFNYKRLIRLREHFVPEMKSSFEQMEWNRGKN